MPDPTPDPLATPEAVGPGVGTGQPLAIQKSDSARQAFRDIRRQLSDEELTQPGVQKLILDELERSDSECEELRTYSDRFHQVDKRAAVLEEKLRADRAIEIAFGVGTALGGAILGLSPYFWELFAPDRVPGTIVLGLGLAIMAGATLARVIKR